MIPDNVRQAIEQILHTHHALPGSWAYDELEEWFYSQPAMPQAPWEDAPEWATAAVVNLYIDSVLPASFGYRWLWLENAWIDESGIGRASGRTEEGPIIELELGIDIRITQQRRPEAEE